MKNRTTARYLDSFPFLFGDSRYYSAPKHNKKNKHNETGPIEYGLQTHSLPAMRTINMLCVSFCLIRRIDCFVKAAPVRQSTEEQSEDNLQKHSILLGTIPTRHRTCDQSHNLTTPSKPPVTTLLVSCACQATLVTAVPPPAAAPSFPPPACILCHILPVFQSQKQT